jgi:hypothetical protein
MSGGETMNTINKLGLIKILFSLLAFGSVLYLTSGHLRATKDGRNEGMGESSLLIDDFSSGNGVSSLGEKWRMFTDQVMGGVSTATSGYDTKQGRPCLRLKGTVSLENNGGFVQIALPLARLGRTFDASEYRGVRVWVYGNGEDYHIHLRTSQTALPWQYYGAKFFAGSQWQKVDLPFTRFEPENLPSPLDPKKLERIAVVAIKKAFEVDIAVSRIEFYR